MKQQAASALLHNIWAERTLGKVDSLIKRAPNADITFIDSVTKAKANYSVDWFLKKDSHMREKIVTFCIKQGAKYKQTGKERRLRNEKIMIDRLKEKAQKRDMKVRNKLSKAIKVGLSNGLTADSELFNTLTGFQREKLEKLLDNNLTQLENSYLYHVWNVNNSNVLFMGKIIKVKNIKSGIANTKTLIIAYWKNNEKEEDAEDYKVNLDVVLTDMIYGDLIFCES
nr:uncharacterized protein LOC124810793 [Hydra vulgaris]